MNQPAEGGWMLYMKFPSHSCVAWRWWVTYRTYLKSLRDPDGLTGPEAIPHCWSWACRWGWAPRTRSTSSSHLSSRSLPQGIHAGRLMWSPMTKDSGYNQSKSPSGVQGPTHTQVTQHPLDLQLGLVSMRDLVSACGNFILCWPYSGCFCHSSWRSELPWGFTGHSQQITFVHRGKKCHNKDSFLGICE